MRGGEVLRENGHGEGATLIHAQTLIQRENEPIEYLVRLKPLFGEPDVFYRVVLDECGVVSTYRSR